MTRGDGGIDVETVSRNQMEPVVAVNTDGSVAFANERFYEISQLTSEPVIGSDFAVFGRVVEDGFEALEAAVETVSSGESTEERVELSMSHPETAPVPRRLPAEARVTPIRTDGETEGAIVSLRRIGTRKAYERQLERQNERLEEFASVVAHDLRNPLNVAEGHVQLAAAECDSAHLAEAEDALGRMWTIIDDTLTLAKHGQDVGTKEHVTLSTLLERCWATVETDDASLAVESDLTIEADPDRLRNLFENLIRNAAEHGSASRRASDDAAEHGSASGGGVTVRVGAIDGSETGFYVADDGPGIPPEERDRVFDLGYTTAEAGTGYGLAIVKWIAEAHGWDVTVTEGDDGGARFEFTGVDIVG
ncbi:sensor histidine kinase [Halobellus rarus]|uniref:histidine kinase n=1 Tax=Halobellus rarus TaxID=1126237 RepID=A0ABD6CRR0_9EURY|nr:PAS domain-containing sensor histidine kinase [Halobellus rarus]